MRTFIKIDFTKRAGKVNPWLHCAGFAPTIVNRNPIYEDAIRSLNLKATRTHDWALTNSGQRVIDTHFIFPLLHLDARDPRNYIFEPTDRIISLSRDMGLKIFYRLGTSIEHTGKDWGFNTLTPKDIDNYAEALAGIVRHYTQGWANGFKWDIEYWELFNEPDKHSCWRGDGEEFIKLFVTCLKRLKSEFPKLKIGGPALAAPKKQYIANLLEACRAEGVVPDFISWHLYSSDPREVVGQVDEIRKLVDDCGAKKCKLIIDEWHYIVSWEGVVGSSPEILRTALSGASGHNGIDSAAFTLATIALMHDHPIDQSYFYGHGTKGYWGWLGDDGKPNKVYHALRIFGEIVKNYTDRAKCVSEDDYITTFAALSKDGKKGCALVVDYRGRERIIDVEVKGMEGVRKVSAIVLDDANDCIPFDVKLEDGHITLVKSSYDSAIYLITFEK